MTSKQTLATNSPGSSSKTDVKAFANPKVIQNNVNQKVKGKNKTANRRAYENEISTQFENNLKLGKKNTGNNKKNQISLKHLLHYESYKELDEYKSSHSKPRTRRPSRGNDFRPDKYKVPLTGMSFINLNYKFVVDHRSSYKPQELDPNVPVSQDDIIRIIAPAGNACPICLSDEPVAPRMITACGHILCLKCLLSLLETEIPSFRKTQSSAVVEKYNDCPLCSSIIRKNETKPVLLTHIDERFETPKVGDDVIMSLMSRPYNKLFSVPRSIESIHYQINNFPSVNIRQPDLKPYLRLFKADISYILNMYEEERQAIKQNYEEEKELYNDDGKFSSMALKEIDKDAAKWVEKFKDATPTKENSTIVKNEEITSSNSFFYYQTGFNARSIYVLSPMDIKVLKTSYGDDYANLPVNLVAKVENIQYEELTPDNATKKYKYLSHLPLGTSIGFIQCNWYRNEYISQDTWTIFKDDLTKRTKKSQKKLQKEERDKKRAQNEEERRTKLFYERENNPLYNANDPDDDYVYDSYHGSGGSLNIIDNRDLLMPTLANPSTAPSLSDVPEEEEDSGESYSTTVWGTKIKKAEKEEDYGDDDWDAEEMIRKAKAEMERQESNGTSKKKKKKKLILLSSNY